MKPRLLFYPIVAALVALIIRAATAPPADGHRLSGHPRTLTGQLALAKRQVAHDRRALRSTRTLSWRWVGPLPFRVLAHRYWLGRDIAYRNALQRRVLPPLGPSWLVRAFLCIHGGEGAWNANTGNGYFGGLQMDYGFMRTYGSAYLARYGTADHWPPAVQIAVAIRAYASGRGFYPWPNTARACGLL
jgi:hypothetical protein